MPAEGITRACSPSRSAQPSPAGSIPATIRRKEAAHHMKTCIRRILTLLLALCAGVLLFFGTKGYLLYRTATAEQSLEQKVQAIRSDGRYTRITGLPPIYLDAVIAVEDHRFYRHAGIDPTAIVRAAWNDLKACRFVEGGSTITQQLAKNLCFSQEKKIERKIAEVFAAFALERRYTKDEILELYVNTIYYGNGWYRIRDASLGYFGREPADMTDAECTLLAGIPNAPSAYSPTSSPELAAQRQRQVLRKMVKYGNLPQARADALAAAGIRLSGEAHDGKKPSATAP